MTAPAVEPRRAPGLERAAFRWQRALDADETALVDAEPLPAGERAQRLHELARERDGTAQLLDELGHVLGVRHPPWLAPVPVQPQLLGLRRSVRACLFDLDDVLTDSGVVHALAWAEVFDAFLLGLSERAGRHFVPFDRDADYREHIDSRSRLEGVHAFLASRGIRLPEGWPDDPPDAETAHGLARRKRDTLERIVRGRGVNARPGARRYLLAAERAGIGRAVVSASATTVEMLEVADLDELVDTVVDGTALAAEGMRPRPAPDMLLAACRRLGVVPGEAVAFAHSPASVAAALAAGAAVVGVAEGADAEILHGFGAERVVPSLRVLLDRRLTAGL